MIVAAFIFEILFTIGFPIVLAAWLIRRFKTGWRLFWVGVATFIGSQVVHIPLLQGLTVALRGVGLQLSGTTLLLFNAVVLGLAAGLCEETARWVGYKLLKEKGKTFGAAVTLAAGHGGIESILLAGVVVLINLVVMMVITTNPSILNTLPGDTAAQLKASADSFWSVNPTLPLAGAFERLVAITLHTSLSIMVWLAFVRRNALWYVAAVLWHAVVDALSVYLSGSGVLTTWGLEGVIALSLLFNIPFIYWAYRKYSQPPAAPQPEALEPTSAA
jgi:uncharacterized membrane protein YhfC